MVVLPMATGNSHHSFYWKLNIQPSTILLVITYAWQLLDKIVHVTNVTISRSLFAAGPTTLEQRPVKYTRIGMIFATFFHTEILTFSNQNWSLDRC
jgi:hypothetical protein